MPIRATQIAAYRAILPRLPRHRQVIAEFMLDHHDGRNCRWTPPWSASEIKTMIPLDDRGATSARLGELVKIGMAEETMRRCRVKHRTVLAYQLRGTAPRRLRRLTRRTRT